MLMNFLVNIQMDNDEDMSQSQWVINTNKLEDSMDIIAQAAQKMTAEEFISTLSMTKWPGVYIIGPARVSKELIEEIFRNPSKYLIA